MSTCVRKKKNALKFSKKKNYIFKEFNYDFTILLLWALTLAQRY